VTGTSSDSDRTYSPPEFGEVRERLIEENGALTGPEVGSLDRWARDGVSARLVSINGRLTCVPAGTRRANISPQAITIAEYVRRNAHASRPILNEKGEKSGTRVDGPIRVRRAPRERGGTSPARTRTRGSRRGAPRSSRAGPGSDDDGPSSEPPPRRRQLHVRGAQEHVHAHAVVLPVAGVGEDGEPVIYAAVWGAR